MKPRSILMLLLIPAVAMAGDDGEAYRKVVDSVVWVVAVGPDGSRLHGTGVAVPEGILTAHHVVRGRKVSVVLAARDEHGAVIGDAAYYAADAAKHFHPCSVEATDPARDLALLRPKDGARARPASIAAGEPGPGEHVFSIGGDGQVAWRYADGSVRQIRCHSRKHASGRTISVRIVETSLPLNDGDSGGPLFDSRGEVVAMNSSSSKALSLVNQSIAAAEIRDFLKAARERK